MIDADVAGDAGAQRVLALDTAARWHGRVLRKQDLAYLAVLVGAAGATKQGTVPSPCAEILRGDKAALPQSAAIAFGVGLVLRKAALSRGSHSEAAANQKLVQALGVIARGANANVPFIVGRVGAEILAVDVMVADQARQLLAPLGAARPAVGMIVDADLVGRRCVDPAKPIRHPADVDGAGVPHRRIGGKAWAGGEHRQYKDQPTHRSQDSRCEVVR